MSWCSICSLAYLVGYVGLTFFAVEVFRFLFILLRPRKKLSTFGEWTVITGGTDGIGKAMAKELAKQGQHLVIIGRNEEKLMNMKEVGSFFFFFVKISKICLLFK